MDKRITITLDSANEDRQFPAYQLSLNVAEGDSGHGYRLMGPKYIGQSRNLRTADINERDANEIRAILGEVFPVENDELRNERNALNARIVRARKLIENTNMRPEDADALLAVLNG